MAIAQNNATPLTYYVEVDEVIVHHRETWAQAVLAAQDFLKQRGRQILIWDSAGNPYPNWPNS